MYEKAYDKSFLVEDTITELFYKLKREQPYSSECIFKFKQYLLSTCE